MQYSLTSTHYLHRGTLVTLPLLFTSLHHTSQRELPSVVTDLMLMGRLYLLACSSTKHVDISLLNDAQICPS